MTIKSLLSRLGRRDLVSRLGIHWRINVRRHLTKDGITDQQYLLAHREVTTILDVGANLGHVAGAYARAFPTSQVIAFEPAPVAVEALRLRFVDAPLVSVVDAAVTDTDGGFADFHVTPTLGTSSLLLPLGEVSQVIQVPRLTLDTWAASRGIHDIDICKIDVEGAEVDVLDGASNLLAHSAIGLVYAEVRLVAETAGGALLHEVASRLARDGYRLHNVYDLVESRARGAIYGNAIFLGPRLQTEIATRCGDQVFIHRFGHR